MSANCKESDLKYIAGIVAYPKRIAMVAGRPVFDSSTAPDKVTVITTGSVHPFNVPLTKGTAKMSDKMSDGVHAHYHNVTVSFETPRNRENDELLLRLKKEPHELLITFFGGYTRYIRTDQTGYQFSWDEQDGKTKCEMKLTNGSGYIDEPKIVFNTTRPDVPQPDPGPEIVPDGGQDAQLAVAQRIGYDTELRFADLQFVANRAVNAQGVWTEQANCRSYIVEAENTAAAYDYFTLKAKDAKYVFCDRTYFADGHEAGWLADVNEDFGYSALASNSVLTDAPEGARSLIVTFEDWDNSFATSNPTIMKQSDDQTGD